MAYAANPGELVLDNQTNISESDTQNSPYTTALLRYLEEPGLDVRVIFRKVRDAVKLSTEGQYQQQPVTYDGLPAEGVYLTALPAEALAAERLTRLRPGEPPGAPRGPPMTAGAIGKGGRSDVEEPIRHSEGISSGWAFRSRTSSGLRDESPDSRG